jgi:hypothetical protein
LSEDATVSRFVAIFCEDIARTQAIVDSAMKLGQSISLMYQILLVTSPQGSGTHKVLKLFM